MESTSRLSVCIISFHFHNNPVKSQSQDKQTLLDTLILSGSGLGVMVLLGPEEPYLEDKANVYMKYCFMR